MAGGIITPEVRMPTEVAIPAHHRLKVSVQPTTMELTCASA